MTARRVWSRDAGGDRGAVIPFVALALVTLIIMTAFSLDIGRQILRRREAQAVADVTALDLSRLVNGRSALAITTDPKWATTKSEAATRNNWVNTQLVPELGLWDAASGTFTSMGLGSAGVPNAVRVTATDTVNFFFAGVIGINNGDVSRSSVATNGAQACYSIGSFAAAFQTNSALLGPLLDNALSVSAVSYTGLANAQVNLADIAANLGFGTPTDLLTSNVNERDFILAEASALSQSGDVADAAALQAIATHVSGSSSFDFGQLISAQQGGSAALSTAFNALDLLSGAAALSNGSHTLTGNVVVPNVGSTSITLTEGPVGNCGPVGGTPTNTSQVNFSVAINISVPVPLLPPVTVTATIGLTSASAQGNLVSPLSCGPPGAMNVTVAGQLITPTITLSAPVGGTATINASPQSTGGTVPFAIPPPLPQTQSTGSGVLVTGVSGSGTGALGALVPTLLPLLTPIVNTLNTLITGPLSLFAGLKVAGADVTAQSMDCQAIKLSQ